MDKSLQIGCETVVGGEHDRDAAREIIAEAQSAAHIIPRRTRLIVNDATVEKLGELLNENPRGLLVVRDELPGLLAKLEDEAFQIDRAFYLEAFNGDASFKYDRIGRGTVEIEMATLSMVGGVQPARIAPIVRGAVTGSSADGLVQRLQLAVWPIRSLQFTTREMDNGTLERKVAVQIWDKLVALEKLARHLGLFSIHARDQEKTANPMQELLSEFQKHAR